MDDQIPEHAIAVIGISGRFPGAKNVESFWENILQNRESITVFSNEELIRAGISQTTLSSNNYVKARGVLDEVELFDADFFGIPPHEAQLIDPQQRLFLECASEALENACYCPTHYSGSIGVYGGTARSTYFLHHLYPHRDLMETMGNYLIRIGNEQDFLTTRVSYQLNLKGPSLSIQTACSTSLVALCTACDHLLTYQCDMALAGGTSIFLPQQNGYTYQEGMIFSPDGHCKPFDANAQGTVPSNGVGVVVLKRLKDALADRDHIYAVVKGYGVNNDGGEKMSYAAPSAKGQAAVIESALTMARVDPATISYIEAHGTGTLLGDPIEMEALTKAFRQFTQEQGFCGIGSVKSNIGHCMEAAGIIGFIKTVLALSEKKLPPTLHYNTANPHINSEDSPFYVNTILREWAPSSSPRRACVSSFGVGGTNAHAILEEALERPLSLESADPQLLILSAKTPSALNTMTNNLGHYLRKHLTLSLRDVAYSLQVGRQEFEYRKAFVCRNREEAIRALLDPNSAVFSPSTELEQQLLEKGNTWVSGSIIDWSLFWSNQHPSRIPLPTYPFEKKRYWIDPPNAIGIAQTKIFPAQKSSSVVENSLLRIWKEFLQVEAFDLDDDFFSLGGDSLAAIQVLSQIEKELNISLKLHIFYQFPTISKLSNIISQKISENSSLISLKESTSNGYPPLFLIHAIDGNVFTYRSLAKIMIFPGAIFGIQATDAKKHPQTIEEIASSYIDKITQIQAKGPYLLCGSSLGGIIAYEMALQLEEKGLKPAFLSIIDAIHPKCENLPQNNDWEMLACLSELLEEKETSPAALQQLSSASLIEKILTPMGLNKLPEKDKEATFEQIQYYLKAVQLYHPKSYSGNVLFIQAKERFFRMKHVSLADTWRPLIGGKMTIHEITGSHLSMLRESNIRDLANQLDSSIKAALTLQNP